MKIQEQDIYHGPALMQIVETKNFTAINMAEKRYGHYIVNHNIYIMIKYAKKGIKGCFQFTFSPSDLSLVDADLKKPGSFFVLLVCGHDTICALTADEVGVLLDMADLKSQQSVKVETPANKGMRCTGSEGRQLNRVIAHKRFPAVLFTQESDNA